MVQHVIEVHRGIVSFPSIEPCLKGMVQRIP